MATRDVLVLNTTASRAETQQGTDTVAIRGNSSQALSVENSSGTSILSVDSYSSSIQLTGDITASGNISSSLSSTASMGRLEATTLIGSAFNLTNTALENTISSSAQIAPYISGSFRRGFEFTGTIGDQPGGLDNKITASFGRIVATSLSGSAANLTNTDLDNTISGSAQIASQISGAFTSGFNFVGKISGSVTSTGSFSRIDAITLAGDGTELTNIAITNTISGSAQIASQISGAFNKGFEYEGTIQPDPAGTFTVGPNPNTEAYKLSATGTPSAGIKWAGLNYPFTAQGETEIFDGTSFSEVNDLITDRYYGSHAGTQNASVTAGGEIPFVGNSSNTEEWNGTNWSEVNDLPAAELAGNNSFGFSQNAAAFINYNEQYEYNGTNWTDVGTTPFNTGGARGVAGGGTEAALSVVRANFSATSATKEYDGSSWSEGGATTVGFGGGAMAGIQNDAVIAGTTPSDNALGTSDMIGCSENYNGTSWSVGPGLGRSVAYGGFFGRTGTGAVAGGAHFVGGMGMGSPNYIGTALKLHAGTIVQVTGSFDRVVATTITGDISNMTGVGRQNMISGSAQIASNISGSFNKGFTFDGKISGSATSTGSFAKFVATKAVGDISAMSNIFPRNTVSSSAQLASNISGAFDHGFEFVGKISASAGNTNTGSFSHLVATTITGDVSGMTGTAKAGLISGSAQIASQISGSFNKGFEYVGAIKKGFGTWAAGANMINSHRCSTTGCFAGAGTKSSFMIVDLYKNTELWDGSSWTEANNRNDENMLSGGGAGTSNSAIIFGGLYLPTYVVCAGSEEWNGTNWSDSTDLITAITNGGSAGQSSSENALYFGGTTYPTKVGNTQEWNGSAWSELNDLINSARSNVTGLGTTEAALAVGSSTGPNIAGNTEQWNGTNWSEVAAHAIGGPSGIGQPYNNFHDNGAGGGIVNDAHVYGGSTNGGPYRQGNSLIFDGTTWAQDAALNTVRRYVSGNGTTSGNVIAVGGSDNAQATEVFTSAPPTTGSFGRVEVDRLSGNVGNMTNINFPGIVSGSGQLASNISGSFNKGFTFTGTIQNTPYTFTEVAALNVGRQSLGASGIKTAGLVFGGYAHPTQVNSTETFNGSSWSEVNNLNTAGRGIGGSGTSTATVAFGGHPTRNQYTEEWNGTNWSEVNDMIRSDFACQAADIGISSEAAIAAGSCTTATFGASSVLCNEEWNGTNWATANALIHNASQTGGGAGSANAGITAGGFISPGYPGAHRCTQLWNGVNWSESEAALPPVNHRGILYGWGGSQNDAIITSGCSYQGGLFDTSYCYNGISWSAGSGVGTLSGANSAGVYRHKGAGTTVDNSFFAGGVVGGAGGNDGAANAFCTDNGVASASFSHIEATRITASVDGMTNIPAPDGAISSSAQIASSVSGSFNKGFEFIGEIRSLGGWSSGGDFPGNLKHTYHNGVWGTQNSALLGGGIGVYQAAVCDTYSYNGTSWSDTGANMNDPKGGYTAHGTENAALASGGIQYKSHIFQYLRINTEEWNGSAWYFTTNLPHQLAFLNHQKGGTQNASLIAGGYTGAGAVNQGSGSEAFQMSSLAWDGLSYTFDASMANERSAGGFVGSMNAGLAQGSAAGVNGASTCTEEWNGSAWSTAAASNFPTTHNQTVGTSNNAMHMTDSGNSPYLTACTDFYNGLSWNIGPTAPSGDTLTLKCAGSAGSTSAGLFMAANSSCVQHFDENYATSSMGRVDANKLSLESDTDLTVNDSFQLPIFAANPPVTSSAGEVWYNRDEEKLYFTYDINSWSEVTDTNSSHAVGGYGGGTGDGIVWGGGGGSPTYNAYSEVWNGSTWSEVNDLIQSGVYAPGAGSSNAAIAAGRNYPGVAAITEIWDGTSWTEVNDGAIGYGASYAGTVNAGFQAGQRNGSGGILVGTKEWNGTNWSAGGDMITARANQAAMLGTQNAAKHMGGFGPPSGAVKSTCVEDYNGTSFATGTPLLVGTELFSGAGTQNAGISTGGQTDAENPTPKTHEWNGISFNQTANLVNGRKTNDIADGSQSSFQVSSGGNFASTTCVKTEQYTTTGIGCHCIGGV